jgi:hypothetical protein
MRATNRHSLAALLALLALACASNPAPDGWLPRPLVAPSDPYGAWIELTLADAAETMVAGELLAIESDSVFVLTPDSVVHTIAIAGVGSAVVGTYDSQVDWIAAWAAVGTVSTISNGAFLILTAPAWLIGGTVAANAESRAPLRKLKPGDSWEGVRIFARFPGGLPQDLPRRLPPRATR